MVTQKNLEFLASFGSKDQIKGIIQHPKSSFYDICDLHKNPNFKLDDHRTDLKSKLDHVHFKKMLARATSDKKELDDIIGKGDKSLTTSLLQNPNLTHDHLTKIADEHSSYSEIIKRISEDPVPFMQHHLEHSKDRESFSLRGLLTFALIHEPTKRKLDSFIDANLSHPEVRRMKNYTSEDHAYHDHLIRHGSADDLVQLGEYNPYVSRENVHRIVNAPQLSSYQQSRIKSIHRRHFLHE